MKKETGIIMSGDHPAKVIAGTKTMTRRVMKPQPIWSETDTGGYWRIEGYESGEQVYSGPFDPEEYAKSQPGAWFAHSGCPYGRVGDLLWIREAWKYLDKEHTRVGYRASPDTCQVSGLILLGNWKPSIHMFRKDSRIERKITQLRAERLQDISIEDVFAEGIPNHWDDQGAACEFISLWDSLNAKRGYSFKSNPWVWVIGF